MTADHDLDLKQWAADWQAAPADAASAEQIRRYVKRRTGWFWSFAVAEFIIGGLALPVLLYLAVATRSDVERLAMVSLASITAAALIFGWWNRRGVVRSSATAIADYIEISAERLRRMRTAWRAGWIVLAGEVVFFSIWIWDRLYSGRREVVSGEERFAWSWLALFTIVAIVSLTAFGRWIARDATRFAAIRREFEDDYGSSATSTSAGDRAPIKSRGLRATKKPRRPPLT
jgi:hypothetical protein